MTRYYLICEGETDPYGSTDPYNMPLTPQGAASVRAWAAAGRAWGLQMICASTLRPALDTADLIEEQSPVPVRWDLTELEDLVLDDLNYDPRATHLVSTWSPEQMEQGLIALWTRLTAAYARIALYSETYGVESLAIVASERVLNLLLAQWLGADWRLVVHRSFGFSQAPVCCVSVSEGGHIRIEWLQCPQVRAQ